MKSPNIILPEREHELAEAEYIVSTTDAHGYITSVNEVLVKVSGFERHELQGAQHNIMRHPDMPRALFWLLWDTLLAGEAFLGYIKNLGKDGRFYWVFANITLEYDKYGQLIGYRSVHRRPRRAAVASMAELYAEMRAAELAAGKRNAITAGLAVLKRRLGERGLSYEQMVVTL